MHPSEKRKAVKMKFAVCAADLGEGRELREMLEGVLREFSASVEVALFSEPADLWEASLAEGFGLIFLDADEGGGRWLKLAERLGSDRAQSRVILFSSDASMAVKSYRLHSAGFLLRPFDRDVIRSTLDWCRPLWKEALSQIEVVSNRVKVSVAWADIVFAEVMEGTLIIHGSRGGISARRTMSEFQRAVEGGPFLRCHRSYIVNMYKIRGCLDDVFLTDDGSRVPISADRKKEILEEYTRFVLSL